MIFIFSLFNQIFCGTIDDNSSKCGSHQSSFRSMITPFMGCANESCCCQYLNKRIIYRLLASISTTNECRSEMNEIFRKVDQKCINWPHITEKCQLESKSYVVTLTRRYQAPYYPRIVKHSDVEKERLRDVSVESVWYWMTVILLSVSITALIVIIYVIKQISRKEDKQPINYIRNTKHKIIPNIYSSV